MPIGCIDGRWRGCGEKYAPGFEKNGQARRGHRVARAPLRRPCRDGTHGCPTLWHAFDQIGPDRIEHQTMTMEVFEVTRLVTSVPTVLFSTIPSTFLSLQQVRDKRRDSIIISIG